MLDKKESEVIIENEFTLMLSERIKICLETQKNLKYWTRQHRFLQKKGFSTQPWQKLLKKPESQPDSLTLILRINLMYFSL